MIRKTVTAWLSLNIAVIVLYTCVPPLFFNNGSGRIAGMPQMLFWFTVLPFVIPALMAALYLYEKSLSRGARTEGPVRQQEGQPS